MAESVYKIIELVGTSPESWEKAAAAAVNKAAKTLRDLRIAEISRARHPARGRQDPRLSRQGEAQLQVRREGLADPSGSPPPRDARRPGGRLRAAAQHARGEHPAEVVARHARRPARQSRASGARPRAAAALRAGRATDPRTGPTSRRCGKLVVRRERKGHGGKTATVVAGPRPAGTRSRAASRARCGARSAAVPASTATACRPGRSGAARPAWLAAQGARRIVPGN